MLNVALCGAGPRGLEHVQFIKQVPSLQLKGVFDISDSACQAAQQLAGVATYNQLDPLLVHNSPELVVIATPPQVRYSLIEQIAQYDGIRAIIIEKPLALTVAEARQIKTICTQRGIMPFVFHQLRFCPEFGWLKAAVKNGLLGQLHSLQAFCPGYLFDQGTHMVDMIRWLADGQAVQWVMSQHCDDLAQLARISPIPPHYTPDLLHPGAPWSVTTFGLTGGLEATLHCGLLNSITQPETGPWLQKWVLVTGDNGLAQAHSAAHFKLLTAQTAGWQEQKSGLTTYIQAQVDFYQAVCQTLNSDTPPFQQIDDVIHSLEALEAALVSERQGKLVSLPLPIDTPATPDVNEPVPTYIARGQKPIVSVIIPMDRPFGLGTAAVSSWTDNQRCSPDDFEVIVVIEPAQSALAQSIRPKLRPQDSLITQTTGSEIEKYHLGALQAKGQILFFTEPHALAEPETIAEIINFSATHPDAGFCGRSTPLNTKKLTARLEARMFAENFVEWTKPGNWQKAFLRGLALRREVYLATGGFVHRYGLFAEWLLAATLHQQGYRLDYAPGVGVHHLECEDFIRLYDDIKLFTEGECLYRHETPPCLAEQFFGSSPEWNEANALNSFPVSRLLPPLKQQIFNRRGFSATKSGWIESIRGYFQALRLLLFGKKQLLLKWRLAVAWAKFRCYVIVWNDDSRYRAFVACYYGLVSLFRVQFALAHPLKSPPLSQKLLYPIEEMPTETLYGFHALEKFAEQSFRWSAAVGALKICLQAGAYRGTLHLLAQARCPIPQSEVSLYLNQHHLEVTSYDSTTGRLEFAVPKGVFDDSQEQWFILLCKPWRFDGVTFLDRRPLGLPVVSLGFEPELG